MHITVAHYLGNTYIEATKLASWKLEYSIMMIFCNVCSRSHWILCEDFIQYPVAPQEDCSV